MKFDPFIDSEFFNAIYHHLIGNLLLKETDSPLILGIFGPPGEGKTFQTEVICKGLGVKLLTISPGELESPNAGQPGELLRTLYLQGSEAIRSGTPSIVLINDVRHCPRKLGCASPVHSESAGCVRSIDGLLRLPYVCLRTECDAGADYRDRQRSRGAI